MAAPNLHILARAARPAPSGNVDKPGTPTEGLTENQNGMSSSLPPP